MSEEEVQANPGAGSGASPQAPTEPQAEGFTPGLTREQQLESELAEAQDRYMRNLAETENFKKRVERERVEERAYSAQKVVVSLLPLVDNLERALNAAKAQGGEAPSTGSGQVQSALVHLEKGVELVLKQFEEVLKKEGVQAVEAAIGQAFDPNFHQALLQEPSSEHAEGAVLEVLQKGYRMGDRLLRPTLVKVASAA